MQNLVNNAIKFSYRGGRVTIDYSGDGSAMAFCVRDEGVGIPEDKLGDLFSIGSDFNRPGTENEKSSGMGLILCKEYANLINARIEVRSSVYNPEQGINGGSVFCLTIASSSKK